MAMSSEQMEQMLTLIVRKLVPALMGKIQALETEVAALKSQPPSEPPAVKRRTPRTYTDFVRVKTLAEQGKGEADIARETGMPYTTVRKLLRLSPKAIEQLREKSTGKSEAEAEGD